MARHKSAIKRNRQSIKRTFRNRIIQSKVRTETKKLTEAIAHGDAAALPAQLKATTKTLNKAATKGVLKKKTASRRISRLAKKARKTLTTPAKS